MVPFTPAYAPPQAEADYTASVSPTGSIAELNPVEVSRLCGVTRGNLSQLPDLDLLRELGLITKTGGEIGSEERPTIAALLLLSIARALKDHIPQAEVCYYHHTTSDPEFSFREDMLRPLLATLTAELVQARNAFTPVQVGLFRIEVWDYDEAVYREALLNALTHRVYQLRDVMHVHHSITRNAWRSATRRLSGRHHAAEHPAPPAQAPQSAACRGARQAGAG